MDILEAIVKFMAGKCACAFTADRLTDRVFLCHPSSPQSVTYQAQLHGTLQAPVTDLITMIEEWASSGDTIPVQFLPLKLEGACASFDSSTVECEGTESTEIGEVTSGGNPVMTIIAGVVAVFVVMALVIVILVSILIATKIQRAKLKPKDEPE